jgi:hypothetical protein
MIWSRRSAKINSERDNPHFETPSSREIRQQSSTRRLWEVVRFPGDPPRARGFATVCSKT